MADIRSYAMALGAGLLVGVVYSMLHVRSPAPPVIALIGLLGILLGEQVVPLAKRVIGGEALTVSSISQTCAAHVLGDLPSGGTGAHPTPPCDPDPRG